ncbi:hypothetical protein [Haladaptatus sp. CMAA 1911]|uniref:DUF7344 domain-containing protein n=1 Tax=unclassified Haladaptatus TaxID=2622732 RepID=UPI0037552C06
MSSDFTGVPGANSKNDDVHSDDLDAVMAVLADYRRRYVLYHLRNCETPVEREELADRIIDWDDRTTEHDKPDVLTELHHKHIPKLEEAGIIERDGERVLLDESDVPITSYLDLTRELEPSTSF